MRLGDGPTIVDLLSPPGWSESRGAARRTVDEGGAYVNNVKITDEAMGAGGGPTCLPGGWLVVRRGKRNLAGVRVDAGPVRSAVAADLRGHPLADPPAEPGDAACTVLHVARAAATTDRDGSRWPVSRPPAVRQTSKVPPSAVYVEVWDGRG